MLDCRRSARARRAGREAGHRARHLSAVAQRADGRLQPEDRARPGDGRQRRRRAAGARLAARRSAWWSSPAARASRATSTTCRARWALPGAVGGAARGADAARPADRGRAARQLRAAASLCRHLVGRRVSSTSWRPRQPPLVRQAAACAGCARGALGASAVRRAWHRRSACRRREPPKDDVADRGRASWRRSRPSRRGCWRRWKSCGRWWSLSAELGAGRPRRKRAECDSRRRRTRSWSTRSIIPIRWGDMDAMGHVNNTVYFRYMETVAHRLVPTASAACPSNPSRAP